MFNLESPRKNYLMTAALMGLALMVVSCTSPDEDKVTAPVIVSEPVETQTVTEGATVKIGIKATGSKLKYVWLKDGIDTVGVKDTLVLTQVDMDDAGFYSCVVYNDMLAVGSEMSELIVESEDDTLTIPEDTTTTVVDTRALISGTAKVTQIVAPVGSTPGTINTVDLESYCDEGELLTDSLPAESRYLISGGKLSLWEDGDCFVTKLSGSSSTIIGTWTANTLTSTDSVPLAFRAGCEEEEEGDEVQILDSVLVQYQVSATQVNSQLSARVCYARLLGSFFTELDGEYQMVSNGCRESKVRNVEEAKTATFTSSYRNDTVSLGFSYNNKVCSGSVLLELMTPTCNESDDTSFDAFFECIVESGFYGEVGLEKRHSLSKSLLKSLKSPKPRVRGVF